MDNSKEMKQKRLDLEIGGQIFHVFYRQRYQRQLNEFAKSWKDYITHPNGKGCTVEILPYLRNRTFFWKPSELDKFRRHFKKIHYRFPPDGHVDAAVDLSLGILKYLDPQTEQVRFIISNINRSRSLIYVRVGSDLFFFDAESDTAFFFIEGRVRLSFDPWAFINWLTTNSRSNLIAGITNGFMFVLSYLLIRHEGLLLHGAAVQKDNQSVLFLGPSGAGKSTVVRLCKPDVCFSDDGVIVRKEGTAVYAYRTPFTQMEQKDRGVGPIKGEIKKVFLLEKGTRTRALPIKKNELMCTMLKYLIHFYKYLDMDKARSGFYVAKDIIDTLPVYQLEFDKTDKVWHTIKLEEVQHAG